MRAANKPHVDSSKRESQRGTTFAKGGRDRMFKEQSAGPARAGQTDARMDGHRRDRGTSMFQ